MLGLSGIPAVIMLVGLVFMPKSPRWLVSKGMVEQSRKVLKRIRNSDDVEDEVQEILQTIQRERLIENHGCSIVSRIWQTPSVRRAVIVGCGLQAIQQLSGINTVM